MSELRKKIGRADFIAIYKDEGLSGSLSLEKRPGIFNALQALKKGDLLLVAKRDRLGRDPLVIAMIEAAVLRKGAKIISASGEGTDNEDPSSILMRRMIDAFAEYERLIIKARTKVALQAKKSRNERVGHIPFGQKLSANGTNLELHDEESVILKEMQRLRKRGKSIRDIAKTLNKKEKFNRKKSPWNEASVFRVLKPAQDRV
jgi:DNA invertase Pin-like site-specific DNA recombinase